MPACAAALCSHRPHLQLKGITLLLQHLHPVLSRQSLLRELHGICEANLLRKQLRIALQVLPPLYGGCSELCWPLVRMRSSIPELRTGSRPLQDPTEVSRMRLHTCNFSDDACLCFACVLRKP